MPQILTWITTQKRQVNGHSNGKWTSILILLNKHKNWLFLAKCKWLITFLYFFHPNVIQQTPLQKYLGIFLNSKLNFSEHLKTIYKKYWHIENTTKNIYLSILQQTDSKFTNVLLFRDTFFNSDKNTLILDATTDYIISTGRFDEPLVNSS